MMKDDVQNDLHGVRQELAAYAEAPRHFFAAWKEGVLLVGPVMFGDGTKEGAHRASELKQLQPLFDVIKLHWPMMPERDQVFLQTMLTFAHSIKALQLSEAGYKRTHPLPSLAMQLTMQQRHIIARLFEHFS